MRIDQIQLGRVRVIQVRPEDADDFGRQLPSGVEIRFIHLEAAGETVLQVEGQTWSVRGADPRSQEILDEIFAWPSWRLCWLVAALPKQEPPTQFVIQVHSFDHSMHLPAPIDLGVTEKIVEQVRHQYLRRDASMDDVLGWMVEQTLITDSSSRRALVTSGIEFSGRELSSFRLHGPMVTVTVARQKGDTLQVVRITPATQPDLPVMLLEGELNFADATIAAQFGDTGQTLLDSLVRQSTSYLALWREYNQLERDSILRRAREFGWLRYEKFEQLPDGAWRFSVRRDARSNSKMTLAKLQDQVETDLEVAENLPVELVAEYESNESEDPVWQVARSDRPIAGQCAGVNLGQGTVDLRPLNPESEALPPKKGVLYCSLTGDRVRLMRRTSAQNLIAHGAGPMPQLGLLLEGLTVPTAGYRRIRPRKADVADLFGGEPTPRQVEALEVALNTPDIALIQGPPGTGKTRVIAALERILADERQAHGIAGQTLLTSYQHEAVEHAASHTSVLGLPAVKVGRRQDQQATLSTVDRWRSERAQALRADLGDAFQPPAAYVLQQIRALAIGYQKAPMIAAETTALLRDVSRQTLGWIPSELTDQIEALRQRLADQTRSWQGSPEERDLLVRAIRALRIEPVAFADDGPRTALKLLHRLGDSDQMSDKEKALLQLAGGWLEGNQLDFLPALEVLKTRLLDELTGAPVLDRAQLPNLEVQNTLTQVIEVLHQRVRDSCPPVERVLRDYLDDLEYDPAGVRSTLEAYTAVLAATCQQSVSRPMEKIKGGDTDFLFETVVVDEAARANPLDLLVPMARARRRIVLVGDHRQLPHMLEPDVERQLKTSGEETRDILSKSLFERLFKHARQLEQQGDPKRAVTLNAQYRMHPVLGEFISQAFYEPWGEGLESPREAGEFAHGLSKYVSKVAAWVDIPYSAGPEKPGRSKCRPIEAHWVAGETERILKQTPDLSVGVISFYAAQVGEIMHEMHKLGLAEETNDGLVVARALREATDRNGLLVERLRVGTVDAFQGKEFDVVLLSITRSNRLPASVTSALSKYGFLTLENRLCVAMSRQKRLLIVVGDAEMVCTAGAERAVPGLTAFHKLCGSEHGIRLAA